MGAFSAYIRDMAMFLVFSSLVLLLAPNERFKAYIRLALGFVLILLAVRPLGGVPGFFDGGLAQGVLAKLSVGYSQDVMALEAARADGQDEIILAAYEKELYARLAQMTERGGEMTLVSAAFTLGREGERFGMVEAIWMSVALRPAGEGKKPLIRIEPIRIEPFRREEETALEEPPAVSALKKTISDFYNISTQHIYCNVQ